MDTNKAIMAILAILLAVSLGGNVYYATRPTTKIPTPADTLIYADDLTGVITFDPAECYTGANIVVADQCYEGLLDFTDGDLVNVKPRLAERWTVSSDGKVWTFYLKRGVKFAGSGNELTAKDVVYSFNRVVTLMESPAFMLAQLGITNTSTVALDDYTVQVTLDQKWAKAIVEQIFATWISYIVDSEVVKAHEVDGDWGNTWLDENTAGTGAYVMTTFESEAKVVLDLNEDHWKWSGETKIRDMPYIRQVIGLSVPEATSRLLMLEKGDVDIVTRLEPQQLELIEDNPEIQYIPGVPGYRVLCMMVLPEFRGEPNPLADNRVRKAIKYSIDYEGIVNDIYMGKYAKLLQTFIPSTVQGHLASTPYYRDVDLAKQLLTEAGYPNGITLNMIFQDSRDYRIIMEKLQADLKDAGIEIEVDVLSSAELRARRNDRDFQLRISGFGLDYVEPDACASAWCPATSLGSDAPIQLNAWREGWVNQTMANWLDEARSTLEWADRAPIYEKLQKAVLETGPYAFLVEKPYITYACRTWVEGFIPTGVVHEAFQAENVYKET